MELDDISAHHMSSHHMSTHEYLAEIFRLEEHQKDLIFFASRLEAVEMHFVAREHESRGGRKRSRCRGRNGSQRRPRPLTKMWLFLACLLPCAVYLHVRLLAQVLIPTLAWPFFFSNGGHSKLAEGLRPEHNRSMDIHRYIPVHHMLAICHTIEAMCQVFPIPAAEPFYPLAAPFWTSSNPPLFSPCPRPPRCYSSIPSPSFMTANERHWRARVGNALFQAFSALIIDDQQVDRFARAAAGVEVALGPSYLARENAAGRLLSSILLEELRACSQRDTAGPTQ